MPIQGNALPLNVSLLSVASLVQEIQRRGIDGTVVPVFVDYTNQRVLIGATAASTTQPGKLEVNGDVKVTDSAKGLVLVATSGNIWRMTLSEITGDDGATYATPNFTRIG